MEITIVQEPPIEETTELCNEQLSHLPYYFQISHDDFKRGSSITDENLTNRTVLIARTSGRMAGFADLANVAGEVSSHHHAQTACNLDHFVLDEKERGRGLGRFLLQKSLQEVWRIGYNHTALETNGQYFDRHLLYDSVGFQVVDNCYKYKKQIKNR